MRKNDDLTAWRLFFRVVELGSLSKAAAEANIEPSSVSRRISQLEGRVGTQLLSRSARAIRLTRAGEQAYEQIRLLIQELDGVTEDLSAEKKQLSGLIRLSAPVSFGDHDVLIQWLTQFQKQHPHVTVELLLSNAYLDLREHNIDLSIRVGVLGEQDRLIAKPLGVLHSIMCASPEYIAQYGMPTHPSELARHRRIIYTGMMSRGKIKLQRGEETALVMTDGQLRINHLNAIHRAALAGAGIHLLAPLWHCTDDLANGRLVRILPEWSLPETSVHLVYLPQRHIPQRVRVLTEFLVQQWRDWSEQTAI